ncbi:hypothetical protein LSAT2_019142 [Lamellibrachia satsuma]|nr:hypothetical protein LSAT2_019142 [Lamellibrachia satsuma]
MSKKPTDESLPANCAHIQHGGHDTDGVYTIYPSGQPLEVYCDLTTDRGGWTCHMLRPRLSRKARTYPLGALVSHVEAPTVPQSTDLPPRGSSVTC